MGHVGASILVVAYGIFKLCHVGSSSLTKDQTQAQSPAVNADKLAQDMQAATDLDTLYEQAALMDAVTDEGARLRLNEVFDAKQAELEAA